MRRFIVRLFPLAAIIPLAAACALRTTERRAMMEPSGGAAIGRQMDVQAEELAYALPGAAVQRVGEGIAVTFPGGPLFRRQSAQLTPTARKNLRTLAASLNRYPNTRMLIVDHTDLHGGAPHDIALSDRRAQSAATFLSTEGVARSRICTAGRGDIEPIATGAAHAERERNQRVEIAIYATEVAPSASRH